MLEKVQTVLAIHAELSNNVGRVNLVAEEFDADTWGHVLRCIIDLKGRAKTNKAIVTAAEHASVWMISQADPGSLGHVADAVEGFFAAVEFITLLIEASSGLNLEVLVRMPVTALRVSGDLLPHDLMLGFTRKGKVVGALGHPVVRSSCLVE